MPPTSTTLWKFLVTQIASPIKHPKSFKSYAHRLRRESTLLALVYKVFSLHHTQAGDDSFDLSLCLFVQRSCYIISHSEDARHSESSRIRELRNRAADSVLVRFNDENELLSLCDLDLNVQEAVRTIDTLNRWLNASFGLGETSTMADSLFATDLEANLLDQNRVSVAALTNRALVQILVSERSIFTLLLLSRILDIESKLTWSDCACILRQNRSSPLTVFLSALLVRQNASKRASVKPEFPVLKIDDSEAVSELVRTFSETENNAWTKSPHSMPNIGDIAPDWVHLSTLERCVYSLEKTSLSQWQSATSSSFFSHLVKVTYNHIANQKLLEAEKFNPAIFTLRSSAIQILIRILEEGGISDIDQVAVSDESFITRLFRLFVFRLVSLQCQEPELVSLLSFATEISSFPQREKDSAALSLLLATKEGRNRENGSEAFFQRHLHPILLLCRLLVDRRSRSLKLLFIEYLEQLVLGCLPQARFRRLPLFTKDSDSWTAPRNQSSALLTRKALARRRLASIHKISALERSTSGTIKTPVHLGRRLLQSPASDAQSTGFFTFRLTTAREEDTCKLDSLDESSLSVNVDKRETHTPQVRRRTEASDLGGLSPVKLCSYDETYCYPFQDFEMLSMGHLFDLGTSEANSGQAGSVGPHVSVSLLPHVVSSATKFVMEVADGSVRSQVLSRLFSVYLTLGSQSEMLLRWHLAVLFSAFRTNVRDQIARWLQESRLAEVESKLASLSSVLELLQYLCQSLLEACDKETEAEMRDPCQVRLEKCTTQTVLTASLHMTLQTYLVTKLARESGFEPPRRWIKYLLQLLTGAVFPLGFLSTRMLVSAPTGLSRALLKLTVARTLLELETSTNGEDISVSAKGSRRHRSPFSDSPPAKRQHCGPHVSSGEEISASLAVKYVDVSVDENNWIEHGDGDTMEEALLKCELSSILSELISSMFKDTQVSY